MTKLVLAAATATVLALLVPISAYAGTIDLSLTADGASRWFDNVSDAFAQVDGGPSYPGGAGANDGFYLASALPAFTPIGGGANVFPNGADWANIGQIEFDDGTGAITSVTMDVGQYVADGDWSIIPDTYSTVINSFAGSVSLAGSAVTGVTLDADISFVFDGAVSVGTRGGPYTWNGGANSFTISGTTFAINVSDAPAANAPITNFGISALPLEWDLSGSASYAIVPEPGTAMLLIGGLGVLAARRRD